MFRRYGQHCVATFAPDEVRVLRKVATEVVGLLTDGFDHADPVVDRLFPDVYPTNTETRPSSAATPRATSRPARSTQAGAILAALPSSTGGEVRLDEEAAEAWLRALNDARLAMGVRLDISDDTDLGEELDDAVLSDPSSSRVFQLSVYAYLGYLQESLLTALTE